MYTLEELEQSTDPEIQKRIRKASQIVQKEEIFPLELILLNFILNTTFSIDIEGTMYLVGATCQHCNPREFEMEKKFFHDTLDRALELYPWNLKEPPKISPGIDEFKITNNISIPCEHWIASAVLTRKMYSSYSN